MLDQEKTLVNTSGVRSGMPGVCIDRFEIQLERECCLYSVQAVEYFRGGSIVDLSVTVSYLGKFPAHETQMSIIRACDSVFFADLLNLARSLQEASGVKRNVHSYPFKLDIVIERVDVFRSSALYGYRAGDGQTEMFCSTMSFFHKDFHQGICGGIEAKLEELVPAHV